MLGGKPSSRSGNALLLGETRIQMQMLNHQALTDDAGGQAGWHTGKLLNAGWQTLHLIKVVMLVGKPEQGW